MSGSFRQDSLVSKSSKIWIVAAGAVVALAVMAIGLGRPAFRHFKETRSLARARAFAAKGDYRSAVLSLRVALALNSSNVVAARLMADILDRGQSPSSLAWRKRVAELEPSFNNQLVLAACVLRYEQPPFSTAAQALEGCRSVGETNTAYHLLASQLALKLGRLADAETHWQSAVRLDPTNRQYQLNLATIRLRSTDAKTADAARHAMAQLSTDPVLGIATLRSLAADSLSRRDLAAAEDYSRRLQTQPQATLEDRLLYLTVLSENHSPDLSQSLAHVQRVCGTNAVMVSQTISWMNTRSMARAALEWTASLPAASREAVPVALAEAECYMSLADWRGLQDRLVGHRWEEQEFLRLGLLTRALREQGDTENAGRNWRQAVSAASVQPGLTLTLVQLARTWGWNEEAKDLLWGSYKRVPSEEWPLKLLVQEYAAQEDSQGLYRVYQALLERHGQSIEFKNNVATLGLLLGRDLARSTELAREVYNASKTNATLVSTYAFALHAQGKTAEGLQLLQSFPEAELLQPEVALYYGVLLAATGEHRKAEPYFIAAEKRRPLAEERLLLEQSRGKRLKTQGSPERS